MNFDGLDGEALVARVKELVAIERQGTTDVLAGLAEMYRRELEIDHASSLFTYCRDFLGYKKAAAYRRDVVARRMAEYGAVHAAVIRGELSMTAAVHLAPVMTADNHLELLARCAGAPERAVKRIVADLQAAQAAAAGVPAPEPRPVAVHITETCADDLDRLADVVSHAFPRKDLGALIHRCVLAELGRALRRRIGAGLHSAQASHDCGGGRYIPADLRHAVWTRDEGCCTHVGPTGQRCGETRFLQFHHVHAYCRGGKHSLANLRLLCGAHNRLAASKDGLEQPTSPATAPSSPGTPAHPTRS